MSYPPFNPQGIGTLNETARNMFRSEPFGIGLNNSYGPEQQIAYQNPLFSGQLGMQQGSGINQYGQYLEQTYGDPEFDQKRDNFLQEVQQKEQETFGNFSSPLPPSFQTLPSLYASGGEAMGPPPTRGPDPQGIGSYQQFMNGGPVYMNNGGDPFAEVDFDKLTAAVIQTESGGDPNAVSVDDAIGLMQVLPSTGAQPGYEQLGAQNVFDIAIDLGFPIDDSERTVEKARELLFKPEINVTFGTKYLRAMIAHSGGDIKQALQKYNTGTGNYQAFIEGRKPLDQEAVRYPILVANALTSLKSPSMASEAALDEAMYAADYLEPQTMPLMPPTTGEELRQGFRPRFGSPAQEDDYMSMVPQKISMRDKYSIENIAADLVGGKEALEEGIGGLTESLRPNLRPSEIEFGEDKGGVFRSLMPPRRKQKRYPGSNPEGLFRGFQDLDLLLRKGVEQPVTDIRGEPV